ncbi:MAG: sensor histidine kinase [Puniceicoccaceae bacterium]
MNSRSLSWRWRLVLIMTLVSGLALGSFIGISWQLVRIAAIQKLDAELVAISIKEGWRFMLSVNPDRFRPPPPEETVTGEETPGHAFSFIHLPDEKVHQGANWPDELDAGSIADTVPDIYARDGKELVRSRLFDLPDRIPGERPPPPERRMRPPPRPHLPSMDKAVFTTVDGSESHWRILGFSDGTGVLLLAADMRPVAESMASYRKAILLALPVALLVIALVAWYFAGKAVGPVKRLTAAASGVTAEGLDRRLDGQGAYPEFAELIQVYNEMLDRLERSFEQSRRFSADAAHELNTPLTILQGHLDLLVQSGSIDTESQQQLATIFEEVHNLKEVVRKLLLLSLADSGRLPVEAEAIDLSTMVEEIMEDTVLIDPDLQFHQEIEPGVIFNGDRDLIRQAILNVISNAIKYNRVDGFVKVLLRTREDIVEIEVINAGAAIPETSAGKLFDRFFRSESARETGKEGRGLGLSLARESIKAHKGRLSLERNNEDDIAFLIQLPGNKGPK